MAGSFFGHVNDRGPHPKIVVLSLLFVLQYFSWCTFGWVVVFFHRVVLLVSSKNYFSVTHGAARKEHGAPLSYSMRLLGVLFIFEAAVLGPRTRFMSSYGRAAPFGSSHDRPLRSIYRPVSIVCTDCTMRQSFGGMLSLEAVRSSSNLFFLLS